MTASSLRRVSKLEGLAVQKEAARQITPGDLGAALAQITDGQLLALLHSMEGAGLPLPAGLRVYAGPLMVEALDLPDPQTWGAARPAFEWARAYFEGEKRPRLPKFAPAHFGGQVRRLEDFAADLPDGEERKRKEEGAALWAFLEALARVLLQRGKA